uniref:Helicase ATP-binding domain-containing protein n=1 Tax=Gibberella zeae TaxID=5518 RepID=A0A4E9DLA7_GIBZA
MMEKPDQFTQPSPWLDRLGCVTHLQGFADKKDFLRGLISLDLDLSPEGLKESYDFIYLMVFKVLDQLIWEAQGLIYRQEVPLNARFEVARYDINTASRKPFNFRHKQETKRRYASILKQLIIYTLRCLDLEDPIERPPFKVSRQQQKAYEDLMAAGDELEDQWKAARGQLLDRVLAQLMERLKLETLRLFMTILRQQTKDSEHESIMVSFLCVLSIAPDGSWYSYDTVTPWLSGLVSISRLLILREAHLIRWNAIEAGVASGLSTEEAELNAPGILNLVERRTSQCMLSSTPGAEATPMQYVLRLRSYGIAAKSNTAAPGHISWDNLDLSSLVAARKVLFQGLLLQKNYFVLDEQPATIPAIPWGKMQDNANDDALGYSMADSLYQAAGEESRTWLISFIWNSPELRAKWYPNSSTASAPPSIPVLSSYLGLVDQLLEHLLFLIHLSAGLPARSTELLTIRHRNTAAGGIRNIFIDRGLVMIVIGIHKNLSQSQRLKVIHRFIPQEVGVLLVYYLWLVVPFCEGALSNLPSYSDSDQRRTLSPFVWKTTSLAENADGFKTQQTKVTDQMLNTLRSKLGFPIPSEGQPQQQNEDRIDNDQVMNRSLKPDDIYISPSVKSFTSARMTRIIKRQGVVIGIDSLGMSAWRHIAVAIGRRFIRDAAITSQGHFSEAVDSDSDSDASGQEDIGEQDTILNKQTGHSAQTSAMVYGRGIQEAHFETHQRRETFRRLSQEWHHLLGFLSALHSSAVTPTRQHKVLTAIMRNQSPIVTVLPTSGGKSLLFQLPAASSPSGVTVVIVPLVALQGDLFYRTEKMNIPTAQWRSDQIVGDARLVFVTPETVFTKHFQGYLDTLQSQAQLDRIVIDECHTILEGNLAFWPKLRELSHLA